MWQGYRLTLKIFAPLHIGYRRVGNIQCTRLYVPGRNLWGMLTANIARRLHHPPTAADYEAVGKQVREEMAFTYLFPQVAGWEGPLYPRFQEGKTLYGPSKRGEDEVTRRLLRTYASTALDYTARSVEEGSLHEVEYLTPKGVTLEGYLFVHEGCSLPWEEALSEGQLGGERGYGWGLVRGSWELMEPEEPLFGLYEADLTGERPRLKPTEEEPLLLAHLRARPDISVAEGALEPLVGREWDPERGAGRRLTPEVTVAYVPGSRLAKPHDFHIGHHGIWEAADDPTT